MIAILLLLVPACTVVRVVTPCVKEVRIEAGALTIETCEKP